VTDLKLQLIYVAHFTQGRIDDNIDTIKKRLKVFEALNLPVVHHYEKRGKLHRVIV
jgi:UMP-CMP kinase